MTYTPMYVGKTSPAAKVFWTDDNGAIVNLTGYLASDFSLRMYNQASNTIKICSGPWTILDAPNGIASYQWQPSDVDTPGTWLLEFSLKNLNIDPQLVVIEPIY